MPAGVYLHVPFCKSRCSYCDFATDVYRDGETVERYVSVLCKEIERFSVYGALANAQAADTVYFGGGTPSLLSPKQVKKILSVVYTAFAINDPVEITMEMNPATVSFDTLKEYRSLGINRASFGVQTFNDKALKLLVRGHDANDARQTFKLLRKTGFDNISFDLIAGLPGQTLADWKQNLDEAVSMQPEHLSLYLLEIHEGTPLAEQIRSGRQPMPDETRAAQMYEMMLDRLAAVGYEQYEISNFARSGFASRHNAKYWRLEPVFGFGVSAHSFDGRERYANERNTAMYVSMIESQTSAVVSRETIDAASEFIFLGLRLNLGIDLSNYEKRFGGNLIAKYNGELEKLKESGLIKIESGQLKLTRKGMLFSNEVFSVFV